jgi:hypothetical protein
MLVASVFIGGLLLSPLHLGLPLSSSMVFYLSPLCFGVASFFIRVLSFEPLAFLGLPLFSLEVFDSSPLHFGVASFFIGDL